METAEYVKEMPEKCKECPFKDTCAGGLAPTSLLGNAAINSCTRKPCPECGSYNHKFDELSRTVKITCNDCGATVR